MYNNSSKIAELPFAGTVRKVVGAAALAAVLIFCPTTDAAASASKTDGRHADVKKFTAVAENSATFQIPTYSSKSAPSIDREHKKKSILLISNYPLTHLWSMQLRKSIIAKFAAEGISVNIDYLYRNPISDSDEDMQAGFAPYARLLKMNRYEMVVAIMEESIDLLLKNISDIPADMPVVCYGGGEMVGQLKVAHPNTTGLITQLKAFDSAKLALKLMPDISEVLIVYSQIGFGKYEAQRLSEEISAFKIRKVRVVSDKDADTYQLLDIIGDLPASSLVVFSQWRDFSKVGFSSPESLVFEIGKRLNKPYMVVSTSLLGYGALGGYVAMGPKNIDLLSNTLVEAGLGGDAGSIPLSYEFQEAIIDENVLREAGINPEDAALPDVILINTTPDFMRDYKWEIWSAAAAFAVLLVLLIAIGTMYFRWRKLTRLNMVIFKQMPMRIFAVDESGNILFKYLGDSIAVSDLNEVRNVKDFPYVNRKWVQDTITEICHSGGMRVQNYTYRNQNRLVVIRKIPDNIFGRRAVLWVSQDKTEIEIARRNEEKMGRILQNILDAIPAGIMVKNAVNRNTILLWNKAMEARTGVAAAQAVGRPEDNVNPIDAFPRKYDPQTLASRHPIEFTEKIKNANGKENIYKVVKSCCEISPEEKFIVDLFVDITEIEEAKLAAQSANKAKSNFLATVSHELRTPLNAIIGFGNLLQAEDITEDDRKNYIKSINFAGSALLNLINDILDLSKIGSGKMSIRISRTDVSKVFGEILSIFEIKARNRRINLKMKIAPDMPTLFIDAMRLRQILINFIGNAVKFTPKGEVDVSAQFRKTNAETGELSITVADTGIGMSEEFMKKLFTPFLQDETTRGNKIYEGTGLGLAISYGLIKQMNGSVEAESKVGEGTKFTIIFRDVYYDMLPVDDTHPEFAEAPPPPATNEKSSCQILIVDDVPMNLKLLEAIIKRTGAAVTPTINPAEALRLAAEKKFDLVLTDLWMPGINGIELAARLRELPNGKNMRIYAVTADARIESEFDTACFNGILKKPITAEDITKILS